MKKIKYFPGWIAVLMLCLLGAVFYFLLPGFSFSGLLMFGVAGLVACFLLLHLLKINHPKAGKIMIWILCICICLGLLCAIFTGIVIGNAAAGTTDTACDYLIVLGAGINGTTPSYILSCRLDAAYEYLTANPDVICIVSGGQGPGEDITEAKCMFDVLTARGIAPERIWLEDKSTSTRENLQFSLALIEDKSGIRPEKAGFLSNEFHLYRAGLVARELGLEPIGIPAKTGWISLKINYFLREIPAVWYYTLLGG